MDGPKLIVPSVLIIEGNDGLRRVLVNVLTEGGYTVRQARDGNEGMEAFRAAPADVVLTDIVMPNKDGIATVFELRQENPPPGIIAMSGSPLAALYLRLARLLGATRTLRKPFGLPALLRAVEEVLTENGVETVS